MHRAVGEIRGATEEGMKEFSGVMGYVSLLVQAARSYSLKSRGEEMDAKYKATRRIPRVMHRPPCTTSPTSFIAAKTTRRAG